jgi:hypothetical protein
MRKKTSLLILFLVFSTALVSAQDRSPETGLVPPLPVSKEPLVYEPNLAPHSPRWKISFFLGGAATPGRATVTLTSIGPGPSNQVAQKMEFDVSGIIIGMSLGYAINNRLACRIEAFDLVPSSERRGEVTTTLQSGGFVTQQADSYFRFDGVRGEAAVNIWNGLAFVGGLYYESLDSRLVSNTPVVSNLVTVTNEGKAEFHTFGLYGGAECKLPLPFSSYLMARAIGCPWLFCYWNYGVPSPLGQNSGAGNISGGKFGEILVRGAFGIGFAEIGAFAKVSAVTLGNTVSINFQSFSSPDSSQQPFQMNFTRTTVEGGIFVNIPF